MSLDLTFGGTVKAPMIVAPMFLVSSPEMAIAACSRGIIGSFPSHSTRTVEIFEAWLQQVEAGLQALRDQGLNPAPYAVNLVVNETNPRYQGDLALCVKYKVPIILTSKGAPTNAFKQIHDYGGLAFHDVAFMRHAEKAAEAGADAIIAVCSGAGGHTGQVNPFALVNEIKQVTDKPIILSGSMNTGRDLLAAQAMGAEMGYMGTRFIAANESLAVDGHKQMLVDTSAKDVLYTEALDGFPSNWLTPSLVASGIDVKELGRKGTGDKMDAKAVAAKYKTIWSAGQGVGSIKAIQDTVDICDEIIAQYQAARADFKNTLNK